MSLSAVATVPFADPSLAVDQNPASSSLPPPLFSSDSATEDHLGRAASARFLADLSVHPEAGTPFLIAIHGSPGAGKSTILKQIDERLQGSGQQGHAPLVVRVDASNGADPAGSLVSSTFAALKAEHPDLAEEAVYAGGDPVKAARAASDRVGDLRRQLDAERQALDDIGGRQARLVDTVLFNSPGSRVDTYARAHRGSIEGRLRAFGLATSDSIATYKELVRETAESEGGTSRFGLALRSLWGFKGQGTLIVLAILLLVIGWGAAYLADNQDLWITWLNGLGERFVGATTWAQDHSAWLMPISHAAYALVALTILIDIVRAFRFIQPVMRGASLLGGELDARRRDIDSLLAHQARRVDNLAAEVETAARSAEAAERRVEARRAAGLLRQVPFTEDGAFGASPSPYASAEAFLASLSAGIGGPSSTPGPSRVVVLIDELDRLPAGEAAAYLDIAHRLLSRNGFATIVAADRQHILDGFSDTDPAAAAARLGRCVQLSYDLDAEAAATLHLGAPFGDTLGLGRPWRDTDAMLLRELSVFAGSNPRAVRRFATSFRVASADPKMAGASPAETAGLALALALDDSGAAAELGAYQAGDTLVGAGEPRTDLDYVVAAARNAIGQSFSAVEARRGLIVARIYSRRG